VKKPLIGVKLNEDLLYQILDYAKGQYPNEIMLLARGDTKDGYLTIEEVLAPPFQHNGRDFASINIFYTPFTPSIIGTIHSHPSGALRPSVQDLLSFMGKIMGIAAYPFEDKNDFAFFNRDGGEIPYFVVRSGPFSQKNG